MKRIRIVIADDHEIVRRGIRKLIEIHDDMEVVCEAGNGVQALAACEEFVPDVLLLDLNMPQMDGLQVLGKLNSGTKVVILTMHDKEEYIQKAIEIGADGFILKGGARGEIKNAIRAVVSGEKFFPPSVEP